MNTAVETKARPRTMAHTGTVTEAFDLGKPLSPTEQEALHRGILDSLVFCVRGQDLDEGQYVAFARSLGPTVRWTEAEAHPQFPELQVRSSDTTAKITPEGRKVGGAEWHTDGSYLAKPYSYTLLYGVEVPSVGGDTQFTNMYEAYDALPEATKRRIDGLKVVMDVKSKKSTRTSALSQGYLDRLPPVAHPLVRTHPETGQKALYICGVRMQGIEGMDAEESRELLDELLAHSVAERFQYRHKWQRGDLLIWDNRCTMHKANGDYPLDERRVMHRINIEGTAPY